MNGSRSRALVAGLCLAVAGVGVIAAPDAAEQAASAATGGSPLLAPGDQVGWVSQAEWSRRWWEWAESFDVNASPVADRTGARCGNRQSGDVWFLAGTYGTARTVRTCRVPRDKYLFFPLINYVVFPRGAMPGNCGDMARSAQRITDGAELLVLEVDGVRLDGLIRHRQATSDCFNLLARHPDGGRLFPAAANGYYVMLKPLAPGRHTISFGGALPNMSQAVSYTLLVE